MNLKSKNDMKPILVIFALFVALFLTGCNRALVLKTPLESGEKISKDDVVLVDGKVSGHVKKIVSEGVQRIAVLAITDESVTEQKMRVGVVRVLEDGKISLRTDGVDAQSPLLTGGAVIPILSQTGFAVRHLISNRVLTGLLVGLAALALVLLCFRRLARGWLLLLTLVLSGAIAWVVLPWAGDAVAKVYTLLPQTVSAVPANTVQDAGADSVTARLMHNRPNPEVVAYAAVFFVAFIVLSMVMRSSLKRLEGQI